MNPSVFIMDNYYHPIEKQHRDENGVYNFDLPTALDEKKLSTNLQKLVLGESITVREYHFNAPPDKKVLVTIDPSDFLIVEGLFLFHYEGVREKLDFSIFIDVDPNIQLDRRIYRVQETRGYSIDAIIYQWEITLSLVMKSIFCLMLKMLISFLEMISMQTMILNC